MKNAIIIFLFAFIVIPSSIFAWEKTYGGPGEEGANCIAPCSDGGFIVAGYTTSYGAGGYDVCFLHPKGNDDAPLSGQGVLVELVQAPADVIAELSP